MAAIRQLATTATRAHWFNDCDEPNHLLSFTRLGDITETGLILDSIFYEVPQLRILQGVYVRVVPGNVCSLFGRNGSGKTTLLKIAAGQIRPRSGLLIVDGIRFHEKALRRRFQHLAYLPQDSLTPGDLSVERIVSAFPSASHLIQDELVSPRLSDRICDLSGGERRYLETMLLLSLRRKYVLLDEPFTGVEPRLIEQISKRIVEAARAGVGVLLTDHYHQYALAVADDAYLMQDKQCTHLSGDFRAELQRHDYLPLS